MFLFCFEAAAQSKTPYATLNKTDSVLTFYYGEAPASTSDVKVYYLQKRQDFTYPWHDDAIYFTRVKFDKSFSTVRLKDCSYLFADCGAIKSIDFENFNTDDVTDMTGMFVWCRSLQSIDNINFNTKKVTSMRSMFDECIHLIDLDLSSFDTSNVTDMSSMFNSCEALTKLDLTNFNTEKVTGMSNMFNDCLHLNTLDISSFNTSNVTNMYSMFKGCMALPKLDLSNFNTAKVTNMSDMFAYCEALTQLDLTNFNTENVTDMTRMFLDCARLEKIDFSSFNTAKVISMGGMFFGCMVLDNPDLSSFDTSSVTDMSNMFYECASLRTLDLSSFNTEKVTNMSRMFWDCTALGMLDLSNFNTYALKNTNGMFSGCMCLRTIYVSDLFVTDNITSSEMMFNINDELVGAVSANSGVYDKSMANYKTGFFSNYYMIGDEKRAIVGDPLKTDKLVLEDGKDFRTNNYFTAGTANYTRTMSHKWGTLCLPYAFDASGNSTANFYKINRLEPDTLYLSRLYGTVEAGVPVIVRKKENMDKIEVNASNVEVIMAPVNSIQQYYNLSGAFQERQLADKEYIISNDCFWLCSDLKNNGNGNLVKLRGFRASINPRTWIPAQSRLNIGFDNSVTTINALNAAEEGVTECYDVMGRRLSAPQKGINIIKIGNKTKKVIIK